MATHVKERNGQPVATTTTYEFQFPQPREKVAFKDFIYNTKDGTTFGRTPLSWGRLFAFYIIFYTVLAGLFAVCMQGLFHTLEDNEPKFKLDSSLIGTNPGLGYRPLTEETERGSVIKFDKTKPETSEYWKKLVEEFLEPYTNRSKLANQGANQKHCDFKSTPNGPGLKNVCSVDINSFGPCSPRNGYGYAASKPCVYLKLNKIYDWEPQYYDNTDELPSEMPEDLKTYIKNTPQAERQQVWISCDGHHQRDKEIINLIEYYPSRGFPSYYYPYKNIPGYLSPLVAVQFTNVTVNNLISVECRAWAKNIIYNGSLRDRKGSVAFQLNIAAEIKPNII